MAGVIPTPLINLNASFATGSGGVAARSLASWLGDEANVIGSGADASGVAPADSIFTSTFGLGKATNIPPGTYHLAGSVATPVGSWVRVDPSAVFSGAGQLNMVPAINYQGNTVFSNDLLSKIYDASYNGYGNIFARATYVRAAGSSSAVAVFGEGESTGDGSSCWGGNFVAYSNFAAAGAIGIEINFGSLKSGGVASGLVIQSAGFYGSGGSGIQIGSNNAAASMLYGLRFNDAPGHGNFLNAMITAGLSAIPQYGINFGGISASIYEQSFPSFSVGPTPAGGSSLRLRVDGANTGSVKVSIEGTRSLTSPLVSASQTAAGATVKYVDVTGLSVGMQATHTFLPAGTTISSIDAGANTVTLSASSTSIIVAGAQVAYALSSSPTTGGLNLYTLGTSGMLFGTNGSHNALQLVDSGGAATNWATLKSAISGADVLHGVSGFDTNIGISYATKGTGGHTFKTGGGTQAQIADSLTATDYVTLTGAPSGDSPQVSAHSGNLLVGAGLVATTAVNGLPQISYCHGAPTVAPTNPTVGATMAYDDTNNKIWIYSPTAAAWKGVALT